MTTLTGTITTEVYAPPLGSPTAPQGNPFILAMQARTDAFADALDDIDEELQDALDVAAADEAADIALANGTYMVNVYGNATGATPFAVGTPAEVFYSAIDAAGAAAGLTESDAWDDYQDAVSTYMASVMDDMITGGTGMPDPSILGGFAIDYYGDAYDALVTYTQDVGQAWVNFVMDERAYDSQRDQDVVVAQHKRAIAETNATETATLKALDEYKSWAQAMLGLGAGYTLAEAGKAADRDSKINDGAQQAGLNINVAAKTRDLRINQAYHDYADDMAAAWETRINSTSDAETTRTKSVADAGETQTNSYATADGQYANDAASADVIYTGLAADAAVDYQTNVAARQTSLTTSAAPLVTQYVTDVANGIASLYTSHHGGDPTQSALAGLQANYAISAGAAYATLLTQEAGAFQQYVTDTANDWRTMVNDIATKSQQRVNNLVPKFQLMVSTIASAAKSFIKDMADADNLYNHTMSGHAKTADENAADAAKLAGDNLALAAQDRSDDAVNNAHTAIGSLINLHKNFVTNITTAALPFQQSFIGGLVGLAQSLTSLSATQTRDDLDSLKTAFMAATTTDDGIFTAWARLGVKQSLLMTVQQRDYYLSQPVANLAWGIFRVTMAPMISGFATVGDSFFNPLRVQLVSQFLANPAVSSAPVTTNAPQWLQYEFNTAIAIVRKPFSAYRGALVGTGQGVLNTLNGLQNAVISIPNILPMTLNQWLPMMGLPECPYIPSPDWSANLLVQDDPYHHVSVFLEGQGAFTLLTLGLSQVGQASNLTHLTTQEAAQAIKAEGVIRGSGGIFAAGRTFTSQIANKLATFSSGSRGQVQITGAAARLFRPVPVVGPISLWTRLASRAHIARYSQINLATGAGVPLSNAVQWSVIVDYFLGLSLQSGAQYASGQPQ